MTILFHFKYMYQKCYFLLDHKIHRLGYLYRSFSQVSCILRADPPREMLKKPGFCGIHLDTGNSGILNYFDCARLNS